MLANAPAALETYLTVSGLNAKASLGLPEREVVQLVAATTHGCDFCVAGHTAVARNKARLPEPVIEALRARGEPPDARYEALADFTRAVIASRGAVTDEQFGSLPRRRFRPGPGPGSDPRGEPGDALQLRQRVRPHAAQCRAGAISLDQPAGLSLRLPGGMPRRRKE